MSEKPAHVAAQPEASVVDGLRRISRVLKLRESFLSDLLIDPDDWSFVVKSHAFLESVICAVLVLHLRHAELDSVLAEEVEMKARIEMTKALGITSGDERRAMFALGRLRNRLVHNARDTSFTFADHLQNKDAKRNFTEAFGHTWPDPVPGTDPPAARADYIVSNPRLAVFTSVLGISMHVFSEMSRTHTEMILEALRKSDVPLRPSGTFVQQDDNHPAA